MKYLNIKTGKSVELTYATNSNGNRRLYTEEGKPLTKKQEADIVPYPEWRLHVPRLLQEIMNNNSTQALKIPVMTFAKMMQQLGIIANRINDPELNKLMCRMAIYSCCDPGSIDYDGDIVNQLEMMKY